MATERSRQRSPATATDGKPRKRRGSDEAQNVAGPSSNGKSRRKRTASTGEGDDDEDDDNGDATEDDNGSEEDGDDEEYSTRGNKGKKKQKKTNNSSSGSQRSSSSAANKRRRTSSTDDVLSSQQQLASNLEVAVESANADDKNESEMGIIEEIYCENFMCHRRMKVELSPHINFITGENGSGKSAIIAAIQVQERACVWWVYTNIH